MARPTNCIVFLTHIWSPAIARHYDRLKRQASPYADVFLAFHVSGELPEGIPADITVDEARMAAVLPRRHAQYRERGEGIYNYADLVFLTALSDPAIADYQHYWFVEMDVDFSGDWGTFFAPAVNYDGDLLTQSIVTRSMLPDFDHWDWYHQPADVTIEPLRALMCISRYSRPFIDLLIDEHNNRDWDGIFELTHPTIAAARGMSLSQIGGSGPFTPPERLNRHYRFAERTFTFRPPRAYAYFCDDPRPFRHRDRLYHPVKVGWPMSRRVREIWQAALRRWEKHSPLLGRIVRASGLRR